MEMLALVSGLRSARSARGKREAIEVVVANKSFPALATEWLPRWRSRRWKRKGGPLLHVDLLKTLDACLRDLEVTWSAVDSKSPRLERARELARSARGAPLAIPLQEARKPNEVMGSRARLVAYTDGGCRGNPGVGGWGFLLIDTLSGVALERRGGARNTNNNRMEITAALETLRALRRPGQEIEIRTDRQDLRNMAQAWIASWRRRGWRRSNGEPVMNLDLVQRLDALLIEHRVTWRWVRGHSGEPGNEHADRLTNEAMDAISKGGDGRGTQRYTKSPIELGRHLRGSDTLPAHRALR